MARWFVRLLPLVLGAASAVMVMLIGAPSFAIGTSTARPLGADLSKSSEVLAGRWISAGSMARGWSVPFAIPLRGGRVLVVGWDRAPELYGPRSNTWTHTGRLHRSPGSGAVRLADGRVLLVAGGRTRASCEIYNPRTGRWSITGSLNVGRDGVAVARLPRGRVMVVGGYTGGWRHETLSSTEVYNPVTGRWKTSAPMTTARYWNSHPGMRSVTRLADGDLLVAGGSTGLNFRSLRSVERYDVASKTWEPAGQLSRPTGQATLFRLPSGRVMSIEGGTRAVDVYSPNRNRWTPGPSLPGRRWGTAVAGVNGRPLVIGGLGRDVSSAVFGYRLHPERWIRVTPMPGPRWEATAVTLKDGSVLVLGGNRHGVGAEEPALSTAIRYLPHH